MRTSLLRVDGVARVTGFTKATVYTYINNGILPGPRTKIGSVHFFDRDEVLFWLKSHDESFGHPSRRKSVKAKRKARRR